MTAKINSSKPCAIDPKHFEERASNPHTWQITVVSVRHLKTEHERQRIL